MTTITLRLPHPIHKELRQLAQVLGVSMNQLLVVGATSLARERPAASHVVRRLASVRRVKRSVDLSPEYAQLDRLTTVFGGQSVVEALEEIRGKENLTKTSEKEFDRA